MSDSDTSSIYSLSGRKIKNSQKRNNYDTISKQQNATDNSKKLSGYTEIPAALWIHIKYGSYIKYITNNDELKPGGFVLKNPIELIEKNDLLKPVIVNDKGINNNKLGCRLQNNNFNNKNNIVWTIRYEDIKKIYVKIDATNKLLFKKIDLIIENVNMNMKKITDFINILDERVKQIELKLKIMRP